MNSPPGSRSSSFPKSQFLYSHLTEILGDTVGKHLAGGGAARGPRGQAVLGATWRTFPPAGWQGGPVLALWPDSRTLGKLEDHPKVTAICSVPSGVAGETAVWAEARAATDLTRPTADKASPPAPGDPVVAEALKSLTVLVNLRTGLVHPRDKSWAVETFRVLQSGGHVWDPTQIKVWALANRWTMEGAEELSEVAAGVLAGRRYRTEPMYRPRADALKRWQEAAAETKA